MNIAFVYINNEQNIGIGAGYVASAIIHEGHRLTFFDTLYSRVKQVAKDVIHNDFDILMISSMTLLFPEAVKLVRLVKKQKKIPVLVGGVHATIMGEQILREHSEIDYICIGEGESMVIDFLNNFGSHSLYGVQNLAYRRDGMIYTNSLRPAEDLSILPPFKWNLYNKNSIVTRKGFLYVNATRGCPYCCTYCCNSTYLKIYGKSYIRFRPIDKVIEELKHLNKVYSPRLFYFGDEMILSNTNYAIELFTKIKEELNIPYGCMSRVEYISPKMVDIFVKTGCQYIAMGVECGDEEFRKTYLNRRMNNQQIINAFSLIKNEGIFVTSFNMIGYPFDNDELLTEETIKLNKTINPNYTQISIFYPLPGTKLYKKCNDEDLIDHLKTKKVSNYFEDSVLRGISLSKKRDEINSLLNPNGFNFDGDDDHHSTIISNIIHNPFIHKITQKIHSSIKNKIKT